jgi:crotonobetainyl-CoA:carnitine CoA-transferase CaiB-like acyl-CoA transferase
VINDGAGLLKVPNPPFKLRTASARARSRVPSLGADNAEVLESVLGYSSKRIAALEAHKILYRK